MGIESSTFGMVSDTVTANDEGNKESTTDKEDNQKIKESMPGEENGEERRNNVVDKEDNKKIEEGKEIGEESKRHTIDKEGSKENKEGMEAKQDIEESKDVKRETKEDGVAVKEDDDKEGNQTFEIKKEGEDKDVTTIKDDVQTSSESAHNESIALLLPVAVGKESNKSTSDQPEIQRNEEKSTSLQVDKPEEHSKPQVTISDKEGVKVKQDVGESKDMKKETRKDSVAIKEDDDKEGNQTFEIKKEGEDKDVTTIKDDVQTSSESAHNESIALLLTVAVGRESNKSTSDQPEIQRNEEKSTSLQVDKPEEHSKPQVTISDKEGVEVKQDVEESKEVKKETREDSVAIKEDDDKKGVETKKEGVGNSKKYVSEDITAAPLQESSKETTPETKVGLQQKTPNLSKITTEIIAINPIPSTQVEQTNDMTTTTTSVDKEIVKETSDISTGSTQKEDTRPQEAAKTSDVGLDISFDTILESILKSEDIKEDKANTKTTTKEEKEVQVVYL